MFALGFLVFLVVTVLLILQYAVIRYGQQLFTQAIRCWVRIKRNLAKNKRIIQFRGKYPKLDVIISRRFDLRDFHGLSLTFLWVVIGCMLVLFIALAEAVATLNSIVSIDYFISAQMSLLRDSDVVGFFVLITSFASTPIAVLVVLFVAVNCWVKQQRYIIVGLLIATLGSTAFTSLLKYLFQRERPANSLLVVQTYSFPSGHATTAMALYGFIAYLLIRFHQDFAQKIRIFTIAILFILLIGLSRVVLNQHYLSDVLGGYLVGVSWLTLGISITEWLSVESKIIWKVEWSTSHAYMIWLSGLGVFISTLIYAKIYQFPMLS